MLKSLFRLSGFILVLFVFFMIKTQSFAQACITPSAPTNVNITYPACSGANCNFAQAICTWNAASNSSNYAVTITNNDTGVVVQTASLSASILTYTFPVAGTATYKCTVAGVNSCGTTGTAGTYSLLCQVDAPTATPTPIPSPTPTKIPIPTPTRVPPPVAGNEFGFAIVGALGIGALILGGLLFVL